MSPRPRLHRRVVPVLALGLLWCLRSAAESPDVTEPPPREQFLVIPLRIHVLSATDLPEVDCRLTDADVTRILGKVNAIWANAGIHWGLESLVREPAARQSRFRLARSIDGPANLGLYRILVPEATHAFDGLHVYYIHQFAVNGVWLGDDLAFVQETAKLRPVKGGIDEPVPRVTAHELGHALNLVHRQDRTNLLASGTTGTLLNAEEVETARGAAKRVRGVRTFEEVRKEADAAVARDDVASARRFLSWMAGIPGEGSGEAKARLEGLGRDRDGATGGSRGAPGGGGETSGSR